MRSTLLIVCLATYLIPNHIPYIVDRLPRHLPEPRTPLPAQGAIGERDTLRRALDEALSKAAASVVAQQIPEAAHASVHLELSALRRSD